MLKQCYVKASILIGFNNSPLMAMNVNLFFFFEMFLPNDLIKKNAVNWNIEIYENENLSSNRKCQNTIK